MDADSSLDHVYFPDSGVISIVAVYAEGSEIEMATIGREGCTGLQAVFGGKTSSVRLLIQIPGSAAKMSRRAFMRAVESMPSFRGLMFTYVEAFIEQVLVSVACNGAHSLNQRLARWLLMMRDRSDDDILPITHDLLAEMLPPCPRAHRAASSQDISRKVTSLTASLGNLHYRQRPTQSIRTGSRCGRDAASTAAR
jgi:CRP-like cAMP-binding protein